MYWDYIERTTDGGKRYRKERFNNEKFAYMEPPYKEPKTDTLPEIFCKEKKKAEIFFI